MNYLHTAQSVRCWEQIESAVLFRACHASDYKSRRELSITGVSRHHTLKRCYIYAYIHSCSSRAISCRQTRQSVVVPWWGDDNAHVIQSVSQSAVSQTRRMCVLRSLGPAPAEQPTFEADLQSWSVSQGKLQHHTSNRQKDRLQTSRAGNGKLHYRRYNVTGKCVELKNDEPTYICFRN